MTLMNPPLTDTISISIHASLAIEKRTEFIHPFSDGNGRIGRLWQTVKMTHPDLPNSPTQRYRLTEHGEKPMI